MFGRDKIATLVAEFLGTGILTLLVLSVQRSTIGVPFFVALAAGLTIAVLYFAFSEVSGAHFNPALTFGLWTARKIGSGKALLYIVVQFLGAWGAYALYKYFSNSPLQPIGGHFTYRILVAEAVGAFVFALGWSTIAYRQLTVGSRAAIAGVTYVVGVVAASSAAIGLINPALDLGVRAWVWGSYVLGPVLGAVLAVNLYGVLFAGAADEAVVVAPAAAALASEAVTAPAAAPARRQRRTTASSTASRRTTAATRSASASRAATTSRTTRKPATKRTTRAAATSGRGRRAAS